MRESQGRTAMILVDILTAWVSLAAFSAVTGGICMFRCLTGLDGEDALAMTRATAERAGGVRRWVLTGFLLDFYMPWLMWQGMIAACLDDDMD
jgi:hypothetical protein